MIPNEQAYKLALQMLYKESLYATAKHLLQFKDINKHTHEHIIKTLQHPHKRKLIVSPRGSLKTSCIIADVLWRIINQPNIRILLVSEVYTNSKNLIREIKGIVESKPFMEVWGDLIGTPWGEGEVCFNTRTKVLKEATITAGSVGTVKVGQHYDYIVLDDVNSNTNSDSLEKCEKVYNFYRYLISILEPDGIMTVIGTRYSAADLIGKILSVECDIEDTSGVKLSPIWKHNENILGEYTNGVRQTQNKSL